MWMKKETKANKNKIWEIISWRKGKRQKLLFIDGIYRLARDLAARSLSRPQFKRYKKVLSMEMCRIHAKLSVIEFQ